MDIALEIMDGFEGYALLDSGHGRKLERFGDIIVERPEQQALWAPRLSQQSWKKAVGVFVGDEEADQGRWRVGNTALESWAMPVMEMTAICQFSAFRHLGVFPEQYTHWQWMRERLRYYGKKTNEAPRLLNLFGYTGVASLLAAAEGAEVTHVDASKKAIAWAKKNQEASDMSDAKIRWIIEDARKFVQREARRGKTYHGILVDPPKFGRGPEGEVWDFFRDVPDLLRDIQKVLDPKAGFVVMTSYAIRASFLAIDVLMKEVFAGKGRQFTSGELALREEGKDGRLLGTSLYTRMHYGDI